MNSQMPFCPVSNAQKLFNQNASDCQEANKARECLVPKIASLGLLSEMPDVIEEMAYMFATLSGKSPLMDLVVALFTCFDFSTRQS